MRPEKSVIIIKILATTLISVMTSKNLIHKGHLREFVNKITSTNLQPLVVGREPLKGTHLHANEATLQQKYLHKPFINLGRDWVFDNDSKPFYKFTITFLSFNVQPKFNFKFKLMSHILLSIFIILIMLNVHFDLYVFSNRLI